MRSQLARPLVGVVVDCRTDAPIGLVQYHDLDGFVFSGDPDVVASNQFRDDWEAVRIGYQNEECTFDDNGVCRTPKIEDYGQISLGDDFCITCAMLDIDNWGALKNAVEDVSGGLMQLDTPSDFIVGARAVARGIIERVDRAEEMPIRRSMSRRQEPYGSYALLRKN